METPLDYGSWLVKEATRTDANYEDVLQRLQSLHVARLLHAAMGMVTEAGELIDMLKKHIFYGKPIDKVNAIEELGDSSWYQRLACDELDVNYLVMIELNIQKLRARYPNKFEESRALNRDLEKERHILEGE